MEKWDAYDSKSLVVIAKVLIIKIRIYIRTFYVGHSLIIMKGG